MAKNVQLLLVESVEALGIVGDVVNVRLGFARNFLLPRGLATKPDEKLMAELASKRAQAQAELAQQRKQREETTSKLAGVEVELIRAVNDQGVLYGAITQQDVASALVAKGFAVKARDCRITGAIKRVGDYDVHIKLDSDLDAPIKVHVKPDREIEGSRSDEEAKPQGEKAGDKAAADGAKAPADGSAPKDEKAGEKGGERGGGERRGDRPQREDRPERREREDRGGRGRGLIAEMDRLAAEDAKRVRGWGAPAKAAEPAADAKGGDKKPKGDKGKKA